MTYKYKYINININTHPKILNLKPGLQISMSREVKIAGRWMTCRYLVQKSNAIYTKSQFMPNLANRKKVYSFHIKGPPIN